MAKQDYPALLSPGIHSLTLPDFEKLTVTAFPSDVDRMRLFTLFSMWIDNVRALNVGGILWINGSFVTEKHGPGDIDCVLWNPSVPTKLSASEKITLKGLFGHNTARTQFGLDFYLLAPKPIDVLHKEAYWRGLFGFQHDRRTAKGFVELKL